MEFKREKRKTIKTIELSDYYDGICPFCDSKNTIIRSSRVRKLQELGTTVEKVIVHLTSATIHCKDCGAEFSPDHLDFPAKYEFSMNVLEYALTRYHYHNVSGNDIARDLGLLNSVKVPEATVYSWLKRLSPDFIKDRLAKKPEDVPSNIKALTVDGSYVNIGKELIGKKKDVESFSVTKLEDGRYLLMWWE